MRRRFLETLLGGIDMKRNYRSALATALLGIAVSGTAYAQLGVGATGAVGGAVNSATGVGGNAAGAVGGTAGAVGNVGSRAGSAAGAVNSGFGTDANGNVRRPDRRALDAAARAQGSTEAAGTVRGPFPSSSSESGSVGVDAGVGVDGNVNAGRARVGVGAGVDARGNASSSPD